MCLYYVLNNININRIIIKFFCIKNLKNDYILYCFLFLMLIKCYINFVNIDVIRGGFLVLWFVG